jgi:hypothetical protein
VSPALAGQSSRRIPPLADPLSVVGVVQFGWDADTLVTTCATTPARNQHVSPHTVLVTTARRTVVVLLLVLAVEATHGVLAAPLAVQTPGPPHEPQENRVPDPSQKQCSYQRPGRYHTRVSGGRTLNPGRCVSERETSRSPPLVRSNVPGTTAGHRAGQVGLAPAPDRESARDSHLSLCAVTAPGRGTIEFPRGHYRVPERALSSSRAGPRVVVRSVGPSQRWSGRARVLWDPPPPREPERHR